MHNRKVMFFCLDPAHIGWRCGRWTHPVWVVTLQLCCFPTCWFFFSGNENSRSTHHRCRQNTHPPKPTSKFCRSQSDQISAPVPPQDSPRGGALMPRQVRAAVVTEYQTEAAWKDPNLREDSHTLRSRCAQRSNKSTSNGLQFESAATEETGDINRKDVSSVTGTSITNVSLCTESSQNGRLYCNLVISTPSVLNSNLTLQKQQVKVFQYHIRFCEVWGTENRKDRVSVWKISSSFVFTTVQ